MRILMVVAVAAITVLAGCNKPADEATKPVCPTTTAGAAAPGATTNPVPSGCPVFLPPRVVLSGVPANVTAYHYYIFSWSLENRSVAHAHSMLSEVHISPVSVPDNKLAGPETFGTMIEDAKRQHQDLPKTFQGLIHETVPGMYYIRAYAEINGVHTWSPEVMLMVDPVTATSKTHTLEYTQGGPLGMFGDDVTAALGDQFVIHNADVLPHDFHIGLPIDKDVTVPASETSEAFLLFMPNSYDIQTNDMVQASTQRVTVSVPDFDKPAIAA